MPWRITSPIILQCRNISAMSKNSSTLEKVLHISACFIVEIDAGKITLDDALDKCDPMIRRITEHLLLSFYRNRKKILALLNKFCSKTPPPYTGALLSSALTQIIFQNSVTPASVVNVAVSLGKKCHADRFINAVLRNILRGQEYLSIGTNKQASEVLPDTILKHWSRDFSQEQIALFAELFLLQPEFTFRLCNDTPLPEYAGSVKGYGSFRFATAEAKQVLESAEFASGKYYVQDPATSLSVAMVEDILPKLNNVLDLCAAPGGKSLMIAEKLSPKANLTAADISEKRQKLTQQNFALRNLPHKVITAAPENISGIFDLVFADLPCSNSGVFRRRADALWRFSEKSLRDIGAIQKKIISRAAELTAPGGFLLCSTCSIEKSENSAIIDAVLSKFPSFKLLKSETLLPSKECDGAFAALLHNSL